MKKLFFLAVFTGYCITSSAFRIEYGKNVIISQPVFEDLYIAGGTITINAPVYGDLIIAGGDVMINDSIMNDILLAGGTVIFNGFAGDDIRCAGGNIRIGKNVTGDVVITGGTVIIDKGVTIGGLLASGGDITIDGNVNGPVKGVFGDMFLNGNVTGDIDCRGGRLTINGVITGKSLLSASQINIGNNAAFTKEVRYWNKKGNLEFKNSLKNCKAVYDPSLQMQDGKWYYLGSGTIFALLWYLGMALVMILIIQYLFAASMKKAADTIFNKTLRSLAYGFLFFILVPLAAIIAFITLIGLPVGLLLLAGYIILILLATSITAVVVANWINNRNNYNWNFWKMGFAAFGIFILLKLISLAPFVGLLIMLFMICIAFGGIVLNISPRRNIKASAIVNN